MESQEVIEYLINKVNTIEALAVSASSMNTILLDILKEHNLVDEEDFKERMKKLTSELSLVMMDTTSKIPH